MFVLYAYALFSDYLLKISKTFLMGNNRTSAIESCFFGYPIFLEFLFFLFLPFFPFSHIYLPVRFERSLEIFRNLLFILALKRASSHGDSTIEIARRVNKKIVELFERDSVGRSRSSLSVRNGESFIVTSIISDIQ